MRDPWDRIGKLVPDTYEWTPHEVLLKTNWSLFRDLENNNPYMQKIADKRNINRFSLKYFAMSIVDGFKYSTPHWKALMDPDTHYMYVGIDIVKKYYNTNFVTPRVLIFTGRDIINLDRITLEEKFNFIS